MARSFHQLILLSAALGVTAWAEPETKPEKGSPLWKRDGQKSRKEFDPTPSPEFENVRKALDALTPEQRKRFQENFIRWANLSPEEKKALRDREEVRKKFMQQEVEVALQESGLQLTGERRAQFVKRYGQERKKIEEQLRKESMERRKPMVKEMLAKLREEFAGTATAPAESVPLASPKP